MVKDGLEMLLKAASIIEPASQDNCIQLRSNQGQFTPKRWDNNKSKYVGVFLNEGKWVVNISKIKHRFYTLEEAEDFFITKCKQLHINIKSKIRDGAVLN